MSNLLHCWDWTLISIATQDGGTSANILPFFVFIFFPLAIVLSIIFYSIIPDFILNALSGIAIWLGFAATCYIMYKYICLGAVYRVERRMAALHDYLKANYKVDYYHIWNDSLIAADVENKRLIMIGPEVGNVDAPVEYQGKSKTFKINPQVWDLSKIKGYSAYAPGRTVFYGGNKTARDINNHTEATNQALGTGITINIDDLNVRKFFHMCMFDDAEAWVTLIDKMREGELEKRENDPRHFPLSKKI